MVSLVVIIVAVIIIVITISSVVSSGTAGSSSSNRRSFSTQESSQPGHKLVRVKCILIQLHLFRHACSHLGHARQRLCVQDTLAGGNYPLVQLVSFDDEFEEVFGFEGRVSFGFLRLSDERSIVGSNPSTIADILTRIVDEILATVAIGGCR